MVRFPHGFLRGWPALAVCLALAVSTPLAADITATLDRDRIVEGETVTLVVQTDDPQQSLETDLAELQQDFVVLDRRSETQMSILDGRQSAVMRLLLTIEPKRAGTLTIPALRFENAVTQPRTLQVDPAPEPAPGELAPVFIDVEVEPAEGPHYVHAQLRLTVRVHYLPNLAEAAITPPEPSPAVVRLLDEVPYQAERGGVRYRVLERHYAVFPERSGPLEIPAMKLTGRLVQRRSDQLWQPAVKGRRIQAASEAVHLDIRPKPASYEGEAWQPARELEVSQNVSASETLKVGEPVTRTVIIDAVGLEENMIPAPAWPDLPDARIYPDQPQGITRDDGKWVLGHKEFRYAVVPEAEGALVLPELTVHWWDTVNDRQAEAVLPEVRLEVLPPALPVPSGPVSAVPPVVSPADTASGVSGVFDGLDRWKALAALFAVLWVATLVLYLRRPGPSGSPGLTPAPVDSDEGTILDRLKRACNQSDAPAARQALGRWLRHYGPAGSGGSVRELAAAVQADGKDGAGHGVSLSEALMRVDAAGFDPDVDATWDGDTLWKEFSAWRAGLERQNGRRADPTDLYSPG